MIQYPWLIKIYQKIITNYQNNNLHHAIILESHSINNISKLIWTIIKWIFCNSPIGMKNCYKCKNCILTNTKKHPDLYILFPKKKKQYISTENIRNILQKIQNTPQQNKIKIIWIPDYSTLTIFGINILLKVIEEPPKNTFFFLGNKKTNTIHATFKSRLLRYQTPIPNEKDGLAWLKKYTQAKKIECLIALRCNHHNPELAKKFLYKNIWSLRNHLYYNISKIIEKKNFLVLLPILNNNKICTKIYWIIILLLDSLKFKNNFFSLLVNIDYIPLIQKISKQYSHKNLYILLKTWQKCRYQLINIKNINQEILLLKQLIKWKIF
ncbi:DNA polymerase III subunit delta' C-terminal domain-containing protein [Buchnera aphidicola]|uniref:DNA polymerase III subunit delta' C-terminal domain-containing protein n=1 Tax=Buchnera aphidicola TaxID=9 RepID=UPI0034641F40